MLKEELDVMNLLYFIRDILKKKDFRYLPQTIAGFSKYLSPKVDDFSIYDKVWTKNRMIADGCNVNSEEFKNGLLAKERVI